MKLVHIKRVATIPAPILSVWGPESPHPSSCVKPLPSSESCDNRPPFLPIMLFFSGDWGLNSPQSPHRVIAPLCVTALAIF